MSFPMPVTLLPVPIPAAAHQPAPPQAMNLIQAVLETLMGRRALHQIRPHLRRHAFDNLVRYVDTGAFKRISVESVRSQMPTTRAVEASVRVTVDGRSVSCILRLDAAHASWRCSELVLLAPMGFAEGLAA